MSNPDENESIDKRTDAYLKERRGRKLEEAKQAELDHVTEEEKTEAARQRKERELIESGKINPIKGEEDLMETTEKKVEDAAEVAAAAASAGVDVEQAVNLGKGKSKVVVIKPESKEDKEGAGKQEAGWSVFNGRPIKDLEGEYTFSQALKVAQLEVPRTPTSDNTKSLAEELTEAKQKLEALGIKVGETTPNRSLKEEVADAKALLESLGVRVGTSEQASLKEQVAEAKSALESLGLSVGTPGESLELVKEKHHHEEKMGELNADRDYKQELTKIASGIPERIGRGIAGQFGEGEEGESSSGGGLEYVECEDCHTKIYITPETGSQLTCPKCEAIYQRKGAVETKEE